MYNDERTAWECGQGTLRRIRDAARPALRSHAARGNEGISQTLEYNDESWSVGTSAFLSLMAVTQRAGTKSNGFYRLSETIEILNS